MEGGWEDGREGGREGTESDQRKGKRMKGIK